MRASAADNPDLGADAIANNSFNFLAASAAVGFVPITGYAGDHFPLAPADDAGVICPLSAHVRKVNPRDANTDQGGTDDTLTRRILRRGLPYGEPFDAGAATDEQSDRGLLFLSYQTSISDQFEFLCNQWVNRRDKPATGGHDLVIGQATQRTFDLLADRFTQQTVSTSRQWVIPTGGGYFFAPSIWALTNQLA
jgi:deferrochelatase/peroxidase EfeB